MCICEVITVYSQRYTVFIEEKKRLVSVVLDHLQALFLSYCYRNSAYISRRPSLLQGKFIHSYVL
jgi:hypothetical protein